MPYINCDGKTYSRYDTSPYVRDCIAKEKIAWNKKKLAEKKWCEAHPVQCKEIEREQVASSIIAISVIVSLSLIFAFYLSKLFEVR